MDILGVSQEKNIKIFSINCKNIKEVDNLLRKIISDVKEIQEKNENL